MKVCRLGHEATAEWYRNPNIVHGTINHIRKLARGLKVGIVVVGSDGSRLFAVWEGGS